MRHFISAAVVATVTISSLTACSGTGDSKSSDHGGARARLAGYTVGQKNAIESAEDYLGLHSGFSRAGLIQELTSKEGGGFKRANAVFAVKHVKVNWKRQAVLAAKTDLQVGSGYSRSSLIEALTADVGGQFTLDQATHAVDKIGY